MLSHPNSTASVIASKEQERWVNSKLISLAGLQRIWGLTPVADYSEQLLFNSMIFTSTRMLWQAEWISEKWTYLGSEALECFWIQASVRPSYRHSGRAENPSRAKCIWQQTASFCVLDHERVLFLRLGNELWSNSRDTVPCVLELCFPDLLCRKMMCCFNVQQK